MGQPTTFSPNLLRVAELIGSEARKLIGSHRFLGF
jgi:hypothetical protein